jgi:hypothetical protein
MRILILAALALAMAPRASAGQRAAPPAQDSVLVGEVRRLIEERVESYNAGDSAKFAALIAPGYVHVNDSGTHWSAEHTLRVVAMNRPDAATPAYRATVDEVVVRRVGDVVLADALVTLHIGSGAATALNRWRDVNGIVRVGNAWKFAQHSETPTLRLAEYPVVAAPDSAALGEFVGDYEWLPGLVERITQRGGRLYLQDAAHPEWGTQPLIAAGAEAFYPDDDPGALRVFVRDRTGRVTRYIARFAGGPLIIAQRRR